MINRYIKLLWPLVTTLTALVLVATCEAREPDPAVAKPPNILLIISDDQAWTDYGFMGHEHVRTPALDRLARTGVTFRQGYVPTSLCRPSLATIATGLYASQHGITGNDPSRPVEGGKESARYRALRAQIIDKIDRVQTLPEILKSKGYRSLQTGKWWEGSFQRGGFDEGMTRGFPESGGRHGDDGLRIGRQGLDTITDFIDRTSRENKPFFVWYAPFLPHAPHTPPERILQHYQEKGLPDPVSRYYAMIEWFDETVGELIEYLESKGLKEDTLIVYVTDNGWVSDPERVDRFLPRSKQSPNENGIRTPLIFSLPALLEPQIRPERVSSIDIVPTLLSAAGLQVPPELPGEDLFIPMAQKTPIERDTLFGEGYAHDIASVDDPEASLLYRWIIEGDWKLILSYDGENVSYQAYHDDELVGPRLYDLSRDPHESTNLSAQYPDRVERLSDKLSAWYPLERRSVIQASGLAKAPFDLRVGEGFVNPLGYYESMPRFSWKIWPESHSDFQVAYQVQVVSEREGFEQAIDLWDSGKVHSDDSSWIRYAGAPLSSRKKVYWRVRIWDEEGRASRWSDTASLELGLLKNREWQGQWIGHPDTRADAQPSRQVVATPQYLRRTFRVEGEIEHARLYVTAKGLVRPYVNGMAVSDSDVMTPGWTPYTKRIETLTYDLTNRLQNGPNALAASLAGGWYSGRIFDQHDNDHRLPPRLLAQLEIRFRDGRVQTLATDGQWKVTQLGPIRFASIYDGERYEQSLEMPGWTTVDFDDSSWDSVIEEPLDESVALRPKRHRPIRRMLELPTQAIEQVSDGVAIFDMGQNLTGVPRIRLPAVAGQEIRLRFAEALHQGVFYTDNYRSAKSTDYYLPERSGFVEYEPAFTYHGFRYVEVTGFDASLTPSKDWVTAVVQHSAVDLYDNFASSHTKLNQLYRNITWGLRGNFFDIPLDCPQRDERLGWTGDAQVFLAPSMYLADVYGFWAAWLQSAREEQSVDGKVPVYIPFVEHINWASSGWGDAVTIIPWELYQLTGDETILADNFEMMNRWVDYHQDQSEDDISAMQTFGDWLQPYPEKAGSAGNRGDTDLSLISTAFHARSVELTRNAARVLGRKGDAERLDGLHKRLKRAFRTRFFDNRLMPINGRPTQTTYLLGLHFDLFDTDEVPLARELLIDLIAQAGNHLRTGFLGTPLLAPVLQEAGRSDLVYELLFRESYPSWFHSINNGATTTWERWDSYSIEHGFNPQGMNSLNHYAYGSISRWFYEGILGIRPAEPGFKRIRIEPQIGRELTHVEGNYLTPEGEVQVAWEISNGALAMRVVVPKNTMADVLLPNALADSLDINGQPGRVDQAVSLGPGQHDLTAVVRQAK